MDQLTLFDYGTLDLDTRSFVQTKTVEIRILVKQTAQGIIEIGQRLIEVKERLEHGKFLPWIKNEFGWSEKTAVDWMNVTKTFKSVPGTDLSMFQAKALYLLSAPSTPEPAREEALILAESGEKITHAKAQELVAKYKAEAEATKTENKELKENLTRIRAENDQVRRNKAADDECIIRQEENYRKKLEEIEKGNRQIEKLTKQIEELKSQVAEPQTIEKEVKVEVEKRVEVIPEDYEKLKGEVEILKENLKTIKQESDEDASQYEERIDKLTKKLNKKEKLLESFEEENKQIKGCQKLTEGMKLLQDAHTLLKNKYIDQDTKEIFINCLQTVKGLLEELSNK